MPSRAPGAQHGLGLRVLLQARLEVVARDVDRGQVDQRRGDSGLVPTCRATASLGVGVRDPARSPSLAQRHAERPEANPSGAVTAPDRARERPRSRTGGRPASGPRRSHCGPARRARGRGAPRRTAAGRWPPRPRRAGRPRVAAELAQGARPLTSASTWPVRSPRSSAVARHASRSASAARVAEVGVHAGPAGAGQPGPDGVADRAAQLLLLVEECQGGGGVTSRPARTGQVAQRRPDVDRVARRPGQRQRLLEQRYGAGQVAQGG